MSSVRFLCLNFCELLRNKTKDWLSFLQIATDALPEVFGTLLVERWNIIKTSVNSTFPSFFEGDALAGLEESDRDFVVERYKTALAAWIKTSAQVDADAMAFFKEVPPRVREVPARGAALNKYAEVLEQKIRSDITKAIERMHEPMTECIKAAIELWRFKTAVTRFANRDDTFPFNDFREFERSLRTTAVWDEASMSTTPSVGPFSIIHWAKQLIYLFTEREKNAEVVHECKRDRPDTNVLRMLRINALRRLVFDRPAESSTKSHIVGVWPPTFISVARTPSTTALPTSYPFVDTHELILHRTSGEHDCILFVTEDEASSVWDVLREDFSKLIGSVHSQKDSMYLDHIAKASGDDKRKQALLSRQQQSTQIYKEATQLLKSPDIVWDVKRPCTQPILPAYKRALDARQTEADEVERKKQQEEAAEEAQRALLAASAQSVEAPASTDADMPQLDDDDLFTSDTQPIADEAPLGALEVEDVIEIPVAKKAVSFTITPTESAAKKPKESAPKKGKSSASKKTTTPMEVVVVPEKEDVPAKKPASKKRPRPTSDEPEEQPKEPKKDSAKRQKKKERDESELHSFMQLQITILEDVLAKLKNWKKNTSSDANGTN